MAYRRGVRLIIALLAFSAGWAAGLNPPVQAIDGPKCDGLRAWPLTPAIDYAGDATGESVVEVLAFGQRQGWIPTLDASIARALASVVEARAALVRPSENIAVSLPDGKVVVFYQRPGGYLLYAVFSCSGPAG
jgi:hypothetical protein